MHGPESRQGPRPGPPRWIWLLAGTGDGPALAEALLRQGWHVRVQVVTPAATRAYRPQPRLELVSGALAGPEAIAAELARPYAAVVNATHPFALTISAQLERVCRLRGQPLLRLQRQVQAARAVEPLGSLQELANHPLQGERLLLAIGGRQLAEAVALSPGACHHARLLPSPQALQQGIGAGLRPDRLACVRPSRSGWIEAALVRRWRITAVLARQGGGYSEAVWHALAERQPLRLLLIQSQANPAQQAPALAAEELLARLAAWAPTDPPPSPHG
jgi:precorrin-6A/cobalt-precorrin-6A reductase